jgi:hypothetical protein
MILQGKWLKEIGNAPSVELLSLRFLSNLLAICQSIAVLAIEKEWAKDEAMMVVDEISHQDQWSKEIGNVLNAVLISINFHFNPKKVKKFFAEIAIKHKKDTKILYSLKTAPQLRGCFVFNFTIVLFLIICYIVIKERKHLIV